MSTNKVARQSPLLGGLHRAVDGGLIGVLIVVSLMSGLSLHWQHLWTIAFTRLEVTKNLEHKLTDSTALLERHLLQKAILPESFVPTKVSNLFYLKKPTHFKFYNNDNSWKIILMKGLASKPVNHGY